MKNNLSILHVHYRIVMIINHIFKYFHHKTIFFKGIPARNGQTSKCAECHAEAGANNDKKFRTRNGVTNANLTPNAPICRGLALSPSKNIPADGGFGLLEYIDNISCATQQISVKFYSEQFENPHGFFNTPSLYEAADTAPYFHDNSAESLEDSIGFYSIEAFDTSDGAIGRAFVFGPTDVNDIGAFLRELMLLKMRRRL